MSCLVFDWTDSDERGLDGWLARGYPNFYASEARSIAHDCVDHFPRGQKHGPYADELMALGARLWIFLESGEFFQRQYLTYQTPEAIWGGEVRYILDDSEELSDRPPAMISEPETAFDGEIESALIVATKNKFLTADHPEIQNLGAWMRRGVRAVQERYKGHNARDVHALYGLIQEKVEHLRTGEEGDKLIVRIHEKHLDVDVRLVSWRNQYE